MILRIFQVSGPPQLTTPWRGLTGGSFWLDSTTVIHEYLLRYRCLEDG